jgi:small subunit ribosomal protein S17
MAGRILSGMVVSDRSDKTVSVMVTRRVSHPLYGKTVRLRRKYAVHDPENRFSTGDHVTIRESRPHSKTKAWEAVYE